MNHPTRLLAVALLLLGASCEVLIHPPHPRVVITAPAPSGEPRPPRVPHPPQPPQPPAGPYSHLPQRQSYSPKSDVELKAGCYEGDFVLGRSQLRITGAGADQTIIHGNLVVQTQCEVSNLTVTGNIVFKGNQAKLIDVDFFGQIQDHGLQNRY